MHPGYQTLKQVEDTTVVSQDEGSSGPWFYTMESSHVVGGSGLCCPQLCPKSLVFPTEEGKEATEGK